MTQIVLNLLSNALKFTFKGFIKISGALFEREGNHFMEIKVEDPGIGIKEQDFSQLFKAFGMLQSSASINHSGSIFFLFISNCFHLRNWVWSFFVQTILKFARRRYFHSVNLRKRDNCEFLHQNC